MQKKKYIIPSISIHTLGMEEGFMKNWMSEGTNDNDAKQTSLDIEDDQDNNGFWGGAAASQTDIWASEE